ncbi:hypothetical protein GCM10009117_23450 [Gangjinia marincola]|uniref:Peptidase S8/S53 domain-containing protein n=1 Tax=Gangjinia marincola TaxID=578463 RepID=A0ABN1MJ60_9FLAO
MKKIIISVIYCGLLFVSCSQEDFENDPQTSNEILDQSDLLNAQELLSIQEINDIIANEFKQNGSFDWQGASDQLLWSAAVQGGGLLTIGYGGEGEFAREGRSAEYDDLKASLLNIISSQDNRTATDVLVYEDEVLNYMDVQITSLSSIKTLRATDNIRYLDPSGYSFYQQPIDQTAQSRSSKGCSFDASVLNSADSRVISPNALVSWNFDEHNIEQAWSLSTGAGVTVGVIDTGLSPDQSKLNTSGINDGDSNGRSVEKYGTYIDSAWWWSNNLDGPNDRCGHGTNMASAIAAPRNDDFQPVGVAYNCNLVSYRGTADVVLDDYHERKGVSNALKALANRSDVKIISMSIGYPWSIGNVKDAVKYAYSKGKLIFAAGGTSTSATNWYGVIFPASMDEAVAVTGITDNGQYDRCDVCHSGSKIEFTIVMQRDGDDNRTGAVLGYNDGDNDYVGGSSVATATTAGIAALVWSRYPGWSRSQVLNRLRQSSDLYPNKDGSYGWGNIDAFQAVQ